MKSSPWSFNLALILLRIFCGLGMVYYGAQKFLGLFGGAGFSATLSMFHTSMGIPIPLAVLSVIAEFFGGLGILFGGVTRVAAFGVSCNMIVALYFSSHNFTTFVADFTSKNPQMQNPILPIAYPFAFLVTAGAIGLLGAGDWSLDAMFANRGRKRKF